MSIFDALRLPEINKITPEYIESLPGEILKLAIADWAVSAYNGWRDEVASDSLKAEIIQDELERIEYIRYQLLLELNNFDEPGEREKWNKSALSVLKDSYQDVIFHECLTRWLLYWEEQVE